MVRIQIRLFTLMRIPIQVRLFSLMRIRIQIRRFIKVRRISTHWHTDLPRLHCEPPPPLLHCETPWLTAFDFTANLDPDVDFGADPSFYFYADPEPASQNDVDPCGSGSRSATLMYTIL
jgi:hypothetical protein